jgi:hypothetical protein
MTSHWKYPIAFLNKCSVWSFWGYLLLIRFNWGLFLSSNHKSLPGSYSLGVSRKLLKFTCLLAKNRGAKNMGIKRRNFPRQTNFALISTICICWCCDFTFSFLSEFPPNSVWRIKRIFSKHFWKLVNKIGKSFVCIVVLHVKLHDQQIKIVEMRAKSVWRGKLFSPSIFYQKTREFKQFSGHPKTVGSRERLVIWCHS